MSRKKERKREREKEREREMKDDKREKFVCLLKMTRVFERGRILKLRRRNTKKRLRLCVLR